MLLTENVLNVVRDIVVETVRARPQTKTAELTIELLKAFGVDVDHVRPMPVPLVDPVPTAEYLTREAVLRQAAEETAKARGEICKAIQPENWALPSMVPLSAPFPPTADAGDSIYDPIAATFALPPVDDLLQSWVEEHSARKIDNQTVVISAVHYVDFIAMRNQLMDINKLMTHGDVQFNMDDRRVTVTGANSTKTIKAEPTETMTAAASRLMWNIECETIF